MKNLIIRLVLVSLLVVVAVPAHADGVSMILACQQDDDASYMDLAAMAAEWVKTAKTIEGGENVGLSLHVPIVSQMGENDFLFVITAPTIVEWATFMANYVRSAAMEKVDGDWDQLADCPDSALWASKEIKAAD